MLSFIEAMNIVCYSQYVCMHDTVLNVIFFLVIENGEFIRRKFCGHDKL